MWDFIDILNAYYCKQNNTVALQSSNIFEPLQAESKTILNILITAYKLDSAGIKIQEKREVKNGVRRNEISLNPSILLMYHVNNIFLTFCLLFLFI